MQNLIFDKKEYRAADFLDEFKISKPVSSNLDFYGLSTDRLTMYVQFKNGTGYLYYITPEILAEIDNPGLDAQQNVMSIGKIVANKIVRKVPSQPTMGNLITLVDPEIINIHYK